MKYLLSQDEYDTLRRDGNRIAKLQTLLRKRTDVLTVVGQCLSEGFGETPNDSYSDECARGIAARARAFMKRTRAILEKCAKQEERADTEAVTVDELRADLEAANATINALEHDLKVARDGIEIAEKGHAVLRDTVFKTRQARKRVIQDLQQAQHAKAEVERELTQEITKLRNRLDESQAREGSLCTKIEELERKLSDTPLYWCEPCGSYHAPGAPGCKDENPPLEDIID